MERKTILVGTDFSEQAEVAVDQAGTVASLLDANVTVVHVAVPVEPAPSASAVWAQAMSQVSTMVDELKQEALNQLSRVKSKLEQRGVTVDAQVIVEQPATGICRVAEKLDADLVVVGTHGRTGVSRFLLGSVAERVVKLSKAPVLVARGEVGAFANGFSRILVPTDFSQASERGLDLALPLAAKGAEIDLFHAWHVPQSIRTYFDSRDQDPATLTAEVTKELAETGQAWCARKQREGITLKFSQESGPAAPTIQERLENAKPGYDLVAMGSHGHRGVRRLLLGTVAGTTVRHAPCSVLVARADKATAE